MGKISALIDQIVSSARGLTVDLVNRLRMQHGSLKKQREFFELAERFRSATDPKEVARLGDQLGRMVFGS